MAKAETKEEVIIGQTLLSEAALEIYKSKQATMSGYNPEHLAKASFAEAAAFVAEEQRIRNGGAIYSPVVQKAPQIEVDKWDPVHMKPMIDDDSGEQLVETVAGDHSSFAPNLPPEHPANQRYYRSCVHLRIPVTKSVKGMPEAASRYKKILATSKN